MLFEKLVLTGDSGFQTILELLALSKEWADEQTMPSYKANTVDDFQNREIYLAKIDNKIVAYACGIFEEAKSDTSYSKEGDLIFVLEELYVTKPYRRQGLGGQLYRFVEEDVKKKAKAIKTIASSYAYQELLEFYIEDMGLTFNHALLVKELKKEKTD